MLKREKTNCLKSCLRDSDSVVVMFSLTENYEARHFIDNVTHINRTTIRTN